MKTYTALASIVEIGDFKRFVKPEKLAAFLGLVPGEDSSGGKHSRCSITKAGNSHIRRLLVEAAQSYTRGAVGHKSIDLKRRQSGNTPQVIAYADKADEPTGSLDTNTAADIINILKKTNDSGATVIIVTHDMDVAKSCRRIVYLEDGRILA